MYNLLKNLISLSISLSIIWTPSLSYAYGNNEDKESDNNDKVESASEQKSGLRYVIQNETPADRELNQEVEDALEKMEKRGHIKPGTVNVFNTKNANVVAITDGENGAAIVTEHTKPGTELKDLKPKLSEEYLSKLSFTLEELFPELTPERLKMFLNQASEEDLKDAIEKRVEQIQQMIRNSGASVDFAQLEKLDLPSLREYTRRALLKTEEKVFESLKSKSFWKSLPKKTVKTSAKLAGKGTWALTKETLMFEFVVGLFTYAETFLSYRDNPAAIEYFWNNLKDPVARASFSMFIIGNRSMAGLSKLAMSAAKFDKFHIPKAVRGFSSRLSYVFAQSGLGVGSILSNIGHEFFHHHAWKALWSSMQEDGSDLAVQQKRMKAKDELFKYFLSSRYFTRQAGSIITLMMASALSHKLMNGPKAGGLLQRVMLNTRGVRNFSQGLLGASSIASKAIKKRINWGIAKTVGAQVVNVASGVNPVIKLVVGVTNLASFMLIERVIHPGIVFVEKKLRAHSLSNTRKHVYTAGKQYSDPAVQHLLDKIVTVDRHSLNLLDENGETEIIYNEEGWPIDKRVKWDPELRFAKYLEQYLIQKEDLRALIGQKAHGSYQQWQEVLSDFSSQADAIQAGYSDIVNLIAQEKNRRLGFYNTKPREYKEQSLADFIKYYYSVKKSEDQNLSTFSRKIETEYLFKYGLPVVSYEEFRDLTQTFELYYKDIVGDVDYKEEARKFQFKFLNAWNLCNTKRNLTVASGKITPNVQAYLEYCPSISYIRPPVKSVTQKDLEKMPTEKQELLLMIAGVAISDAVVNDWDFIKIDSELSSLPNFMYAAYNFQPGKKFNKKKQVGHLPTYRAVDYMYASMLCGPNPEAFYRRDFKARKDKTGSLFGGLWNKVSSFFSGDVCQPSQVDGSSSSKGSISGKACTSTVVQTSPNFTPEPTDDLRSENKIDSTTVAENYKDYVVRTKENPLVGTVRDKYMHPKYVKINEGFFPDLAAPQLIPNFKHSICGNTLSNRVEYAGGFAKVNSTSSSKNNYVVSDVQLLLSLKRENSSLFNFGEQLDFMVPSYTTSNNEVVNQSTTRGLFNLMVDQIGDDIVTFVENDEERGYKSNFENWWKQNIEPELKIGHGLLQQNFKNFLTEKFVPLYVTNDSPQSNVYYSWQEEVLVITDVIYRLLKDKNGHNLQGVKENLEQIRKSLHYIAFSTKKEDLEKNYEFVTESIKFLKGTYEYAYDEDIIESGEIWTENPKTKEMELTKSAFTDEIIETNLRTAIFSRAIAALEQASMSIYNNIIPLLTIEIFEPDKFKDFERKELDESVLRQFEIKD